MVGSNVRVGLLRSWHSCEYHQISFDLPAAKHVVSLAPKRVMKGEKIFKYENVIEMCYPLKGVEM